MSSDREKAIIIIRVVAALVALPAWSIGLAFILTTGGDHLFHAGPMLIAGIAAILIWVTAPQLAARLTPEEASVS